MGRRGYPPEFRRKVLDLVEAGRPISEVAQDGPDIVGFFAYYAGCFGVGRGLGFGMANWLAAREDVPTAVELRWRPDGDWAASYLVGVTVAMVASRAAVGRAGAGSR
jgi:hypothetical protein